MIKYIDRLHYLTQDHIPGFTAIDQVLMACEAGAKWIQYRAMPKPLEELLNITNQIAAICDDWGTTLVINDYIEIATKADVQGVHIGRSDMHPAEVRKLIGDDKVMGCSAPTLDDVKYFFDNGADYISIGPYNYTTTKSMTMHPRGKEGIERFIEEIHQLIPGFDTPLIVAGGVTINDLDYILQTKVHGIAVSSAINRSENPRRSFLDLYKRLH